MERGARVGNMHIVVIGGGQAAASFAIKYRGLDPDAEISIIGEERVPPYQRPPLSKKYLSGEITLERLYLRPQSWYEASNIALRTGIKAASIDRAEGNVILQNGERLDYDKLVIATGSTPRLLPQATTKDAPNIYAVRSLADVDGMRHEFQSGRRLLVIGGGYIGLEAAAVARKHGLEVVVIEAAPRILGRVACGATADYIRNLHQDNGAEIIEGVGLESFSHNDGKITSAALSSGQKIGCDFVIVGIGIVPNSAIAEAAGIECDRGILVNEFCQTNDPDIYAAGDCAAIEHLGQWLRIESVGNAIDQGEAIAHNIYAQNAGQQTAYRPKPWFWSDQYDVTLQIAGLNLGYDETLVRLGAKAGSQSVWYYKADKLIAVDAMNDPRAYVMGKRIIEAGKTLPKDVAADPDSNLKDWI